MGQPAARVTDMHTCPMVTPGTPPIPHVGGPIIPPCSTNVFTCTMPQARVTDKCTCVGPMDMIVKGSATVFVNSLPAARLGDQTVHGGVIVTGCPTVLIGDMSGGGGGGGGSAGASGPGTYGELLSSGAVFSNAAAQAQAMVDAAKLGTPFCKVCAGG